MTRAHPTAKPKKPRTAPKAVAANGAERQIKIGEAARLIGVEAYVLRFWETQFPFLRPRHSRSKHRYYDEKSLESLRLVRRLLHSEGYTIAGAKKHIRETGLDRLREANDDSKAVATPEHDRPKDHRESAPAPSRSQLSRTTQNQLVAIRDELKSLHKLLAG
jgi:DNA-binding transcriptional MerR regulator